MRSKLTILALVLCIASAQAAPWPERDVVIDAERFAALEPAQQQHVLLLQERLAAILATDKSTLSAPQRKALRQEFRTLKHEMDAVNAGGTVIYLSTAGIIIILLLLIILL
ncbi:MAG: hypothetical protein ACO1NQ_12470 [Flavobacteriales bacterium]